MLKTTSKTNHNAFEQFSSFLVTVFLRIRRSHVRIVPAAPLQTQPPDIIDF